MANDQFISRMMDETLKASPSNHTGDDFHLRRELSRMGIKYFVGDWTLPQIARFSTNGSALDLPFDNKLLGGSANRPLVQALSTWTGESFSEVIFLTSEDQRPWILMWNDKDQKVNLKEIRYLFQTKQKAA
jgi:hypothetical protein